MKSVTAVMDVARPSIWTVGPGLFDLEQPQPFGQALADGLEQADRRALGGAQPLDQAEPLGQFVLAGGHQVDELRGVLERVELGLGRRRSGRRARVPW